MNLAEMFENNQDSFLKFENIKTKMSTRPDLHAFMLLDKLLPSTHDLIVSAEHDIIYLDVTLDKLEGIITEEQVKELIMCGVMIEDGEGLAMFV